MALQEADDNIPTMRFAHHRDGIINAWLGYDTKALEARIGICVIDRVCHKCQKPDYLMRGNMGSYIFVKIDGVSRMHMVCLKCRPLSIWKVGNGWTPFDNTLGGRIA